jgi:hypothetical protein
MKGVVKVAKLFAILWLILGSLLIVVGLIGVWMKDGFWAMADLLSPFNVINYAAMIVTLAPGFIILSWVKKKERALLFDEAGKGDH